MRLHKEDGHKFWSGLYKWTEYNFAKSFEQSS